MTNRRLYHGTSGALLPQIQKEGLRPRSRSKNKGNWKHTVPSNPRAVYLTDAYAWHFAVVATDVHEPGLILEINKPKLEPWNLAPDEDFLEQATRQTEHAHLAPTNWSMQKRTLFYRKSALRDFSHLADSSLEHMGTAAFYGIIPWEAVTRYVLIDWTKLDTSMQLQACDSMVSMANYKFLKERHRAFTRWFFNDSVTAGELTGMEGFGPADNPPDFIQQMNEGMQKAMQNRDGLTVVTIGEDKHESVRKEAAGLQHAD